ncbi:UPF0676 protein [Galdieria sulphuraria]|uniref:Fe2OG dioxygenase domain-containing protein n=1 Tax=Galdieria sulphuraria TaxID=130081 RepID=M2XW32_GALSU|nr:uncharacterized protein Gasu_47890 [Galdieria sulphuraria]EME27644.1 hypothetical protein Gasu_47890 [Galdieria sulphuraria]GJD07465.1 UPF0676 protein [Galdieria sulphuraria]|eukprot:XP_005704164.1 hypothetical protein Gasu_47890 [Galdieria sulphuraria]
MEIPVIDWQEFCASTDDKLVVENFAKLGFLALRNHGIPLEHVRQAFRVTHEFFRLPLSVKKSILRGTLGDNNSGYVEYQMESLNSTSVDKKEALNITCQPWLLPESLSFLSQLECFYMEAWQLGMQLLEQLELSSIGESVLRKYHTFRSLGVHSKAKEENLFFNKRTSASTLRLLCYPPVAETKATLDEVLAGIHSDYGTLTLLFQDSFGGLQVQHAQDWINVSSQEDVVVVNAGDLLEIWTGGLIPSTKHRVVVTPEMIRCPHRCRYSIAVFIHPDDDAIVRPLYGDITKYNPVLASDYVTGRFQRSYKES